MEFKELTGYEKTILSSAPMILKVDKLNLNPRLEK
jgi:hypothetical protein